MKKKLEKNLSDALSQMVPDDLYERIERELNTKEERNVITMKQTSSQKPASRKRTFRLLATAAAACLVLAIGLCGGLYYQNNFVVSSVVDIDVNPSIEITTNRKDKVIDVSAVNEEAEEILDGMSLKNVDLNVAVNAIIGSMVQKGYLTTDEENNILVSVYSEDAETATYVRNLVLVDINDSLESNQVEAFIINQTVESSSEAKTFAEENQISLGKAVLVLNLAAKDSSLDPVELAAMSLKELAQLVQERNIDISDIVDYDADESIWENLSDAVEEVDEDNAEQSDSTTSDSTTQSDSTTSDSTTQSDSATSDSTTSDNTTSSSTTSDSTTNNSSTSDSTTSSSSTSSSSTSSSSTSSSSTKNSSTSSSSTKNSSTSSSSTKNSTTSSSSAQSEASSDGLITVAQAKKIALNHAGVSESDAVFVKAEMDRDDGIITYEIEFLSNGVEYEYEINASSGSILSLDAKVKDKSAATANSQGSEITAAEAQEIALSDAGFSASEVRKLEVELDTDDGVRVYEVEFKKDQTEYSYEISAANGAILSKEKEIDD